MTPKKHEPPHRLRTTAGVRAMEILRLRLDRKERDIGQLRPCLQDVLQAAKFRPHVIPAIAETVLAVSALLAVGGGSLQDIVRMLPFIVILVFAPFIALQLAVIDRWAREDLLVALPVSNFRASACVREAPVAVRCQRALRAVRTYQHMTWILPISGVIFYGVASGILAAHNGWGMAMIPVGVLFGLVANAGYAARLSQVDVVPLVAPGLDVEDQQTLKTYRADFLFPRVLRRLRRSTGLLRFEATQVYDLFADLLLLIAVPVVVLSMVGNLAGQQQGYAVGALLSLGVAGIVAVKQQRVLAWRLPEEDEDRAVQIWRAALRSSQCRRIVAHRTEQADMRAVVRDANELAIGAETIVRIEEGRGIALCAVELDGHSDDTGGPRQRVYRRHQAPHVATRSV